MPGLRGTAEWARKAECCSSFQKFSKELIKIFDPANPETEATLTQGSRSVIDYIIDFRTAAVDSRLNETTLLDAFYRGLSDCLKNALTIHDRPKSLSSFMELVTRLDGRFREWQQNKNHCFCSVQSHHSVPERRPVVTQTTLLLLY